jgi:hypothetical protein
MMLVSDQGLVPALCGSGAPLSAIVSYELFSGTGGNVSTDLLVPGIMMLMAMMMPLAHVPLLHVWRRSLVHRRVRAVALFALGYSIPSMGFILLVMAVTTLAAVQLGSGSWALATAALGLVLIWQGGLTGQRCSRRCHFLPSLPAFGWPAEIATFRFGCSSAAVHLGACWPLMAISFCFSGAPRTVVMFASSLLMLSGLCVRPVQIRRQPGLLALGWAVILGSGAVVTL